MYLLLNQPHDLEFRSLRLAEPTRTPLLSVGVEQYTHSGNSRLTSFTVWYHDFFRPKLQAFCARKPKDHLPFTAQLAVNPSGTLDIATDTLQALVFLNRLRATWAPTSTGTIIMHLVP